jgi:hypothetical protein
MAAFPTQKGWRLRGDDSFRQGARGVRVDRVLGSQAAGLQRSHRKGPTTRATMAVTAPDLLVASGAVTNLPGYQQGMGTVLAEARISGDGTGTLGATRGVLDGFGVHLRSSVGSPDHHHRQPTQQQIGQKNCYQHAGPQNRTRGPRLGDALQRNLILEQQADGEIRRDILDQIGRPLPGGYVQGVAVHLYPLNLRIPNRLGEGVKSPGLGGANHCAPTTGEASQQQQSHQCHRHHRGDQDRRSSQTDPSSALILAFS